MNLNDFKTPEVPERMPWHDDEYYALLLKRYLENNAWRPAAFRLDMEAREKLSEIESE